PEPDQSVAQLSAIAANLKGLARPDFKTSLRDKLLEHIRAAAKQENSAETTAHLSAPVVTEQEINVRLQQIAETPGQTPHDLAAALKGLPDGAMRFLTSMDRRTIGVTRYSEQGPLWERHPDGD